MHFLLNLVFAAIAFFVIRWLFSSVLLPDTMRDKEKVAICLGIVAAIVVFALNLAAQVLTSGAVK